MKSYIFYKLEIGFSSCVQVCVVCENKAVFNCTRINRGTDFAMRTSVQITFMSFESGKDSSSVLRSVRNLLNTEDQNISTQDRMSPTLLSETSQQNTGSFSVSIVESTPAHSWIFFHSLSPLRKYHGLLVFA